MKLLFVCSRNRQRSLTAETVLHGQGGHQVRSAGTEPGARVRVTAGHLGWADVILIMEKRHLSRLQARYGEELRGKEVVCLHIADDYEYMDEELIARLEGGVASYFETSSPAG